MNDFTIIVPRTELKNRDDIKAMAEWLYDLSGVSLKPGLQLPGSDLFKTTTRLCSNSSDLLDAAGVEWDEKIHSANKTKTVDGLWRTRRNSTQPQDCEGQEEIEFPVSATPFTEFMELVKTSALPKIELLAILKDYGIDSVALVAENQDKIPAITFTINEFLGKR